MNVDCSAKAQLEALIESSDRLVAHAKYAKLALAEMRAMTDAADRFASDLTTMVARDENGALLQVAVVARGESAGALHAVLEDLCRTAKPYPVEWADERAS